MLSDEDSRETGTLTALPQAHSFDAILSSFGSSRPAKETSPTTEARHGLAVSPTAASAASLTMLDPVQSVYSIPSVLSISSASTLTLFSPPTQPRQPIPLPPLDSADPCLHVDVPPSPPSSGLSDSQASFASASGSGSGTGGTAPSASGYETAADQRDESLSWNSKQEEADTEGRDRSEDDSGRSEDGTEQSEDDSALNEGAGDHHQEDRNLAEEDHEHLDENSHHYEADVCTRHGDMGPRELTKPVEPSSLTTSLSSNAAKGSIGSTSSQDGSWEEVDAYRASKKEEHPSAPQLPVPSTLLASGRDQARSNDAIRAADKPSDSTRWWTVAVMNGVTSSPFRVTVRFPELPSEPMFWTAVRADADVQRVLGTETAVARYEFYVVSGAAKGSYSTYDEFQKSATIRYAGHHLVDPAFSVIVFPKDESRTKQLSPQSQANKLEVLLTTSLSRNPVYAHGAISMYDGTDASGWPSDYSNLRAAPVPKVDWEFEIVSFDFTLPLDITLTFSIFPDEDLLYGKLNEHVGREILHLKGEFLICVLHGPTEGTYRSLADLGLRVRAHRESLGNDPVQALRKMVSVHLLPKPNTTAIQQQMRYVAALQRSKYRREKEGRDARSNADSESGSEDSPKPALVKTRSNDLFKASRYRPQTDISDRPLCRPPSAGQKDEYAFTIGRWPREPLIDSSPIQEVQGSGSLRSYGIRAEECIMSPTLSAVPLHHSAFEQGEVGRSEVRQPSANRVIAETMGSPLEKSTTSQRSTVSSADYLDDLIIKAGNTVASTRLLAILKDEEVKLETQLGLKLLDLVKALRQDGELSPVRKLYNAAGSSDATTAVENRLNDFARMLNCIAGAVGVNLLENDDEPEVQTNRGTSSTLGSFSAPSRNAVIAGVPPGRTTVTRASHQSTLEGRNDDHLRWSAAPTDGVQPANNRCHQAGPVGVEQRLNVAVTQPRRPRSDDCFSQLVDFTLERLNAPPPDKSAKRYSRTDSSGSEPLTKIESELREHRAREHISSGAQSQSPKENYWSVPAGPQTAPSNRSPFGAMDLQSTIPVASPCNPSGFAPFGNQASAFAQAAINHWSPGGMPSFPFSPNYPPLRYGLPPPPLNGLRWQMPQLHPPPQPSGGWFSVSHAPAGSEQNRTGLWGGSIWAPRM